MDCALCFTITVAQSLIIELYPPANGGAGGRNTNFIWLLSPKGLFQSLQKPFLASRSQIKL